MDHEIICFDEVSFRLVPVYHKVWFMKGQKPKATFWWSNKKLNVFGALVGGNRLYYEFHESQNSIVFLSFLMNFIDTLDKNKKYVFIMDNAGWHKTQIITNYLAKQENIAVEFIPPYSPQLNAIETCWKITRADLTNSKFFVSLKELRLELKKYWDSNPFRLNVTNYLMP